MTHDQRDPHRWLRDFPSTQATVFVGLVCAVSYVLVSLVGALMERPLNEVTHFALGAFILALCGLNFAVKRMTDTGLAAARASGKVPAVNVDSQSTVVVNRDATSPEQRG